MQLKKKPCDGDLCKGSLAFIWKNVTEGDGGRRSYCQNCWNRKKPKVKPTNRQFLKRTQRPISPRSDKKKKEDALYMIIRNNYLKNHPICEAAIPGICSGRPSNQVHHMAGKIGDKYLDDKYFLAVEDSCHRYITDNPEFSYNNNFSISRLKIN